MAPRSGCVAIASRQYGVISRKQALTGGLSEDSIHRLVRSGVWSRILPGVYALWTPPEHRRQRLLAGCLWLGPSSAVSHRASAEMLELDGCDRLLLEFSTTGRRRDGDPAFIVHRVGSLPKGDLDVRHGIPLTSATRTLIDLGAVVERRQLELALESALRKGITSLPLLRRRLKQLPRRARYLRVIRDLVEESPGAPTESALEALVWRALLDEGLDAPERQFEIVDAAGRVLARVDFAYPKEKVAIEADGYRFHSIREDWQRDRRRGNALAALGWIIYRVTWDDVVRRPAVIAHEVARLRARGPDRLDPGIMRPTNRGMRG